MYQPETKTLQLQLRAAVDHAPEGAFSATFSTFNVIDHEGDVVVPGAFEDGKAVPVGAYQHELWSLPVGKGVIVSDEDRAQVDGAFNLKTTLGRDTYEIVKDLSDVLEWSYIFTVEDAEYADEYRAGDDVFHDVRVLKQIDVWSIDPVLRGASIGTGTDSIKSVDPRSFADHADELVAAVGAFVARAESRHEMRAKEGRRLGSDDRARLKALVTESAGLKVRLEDVLRLPVEDGEDGNELQQLHARFLELDSRLRGAA